MTTDPTQPAPSAEQLQQQVDELRARLENQQRQVLPAGAQDKLGIPEPPDELPDFANEWPREGGLDAPHPWDLKAQGLRIGIADDGTTTIASPHTGEVMTLDPGAPNTISPIVPVHGRPLLGPLSSDISVRELGELLATVGIENSVSRGENPNNILDQSMIDAVNRFRDAYGVEEDPSAWSTRGREQAEVHVGAWTWEALLRAAARKRDEQEADRRAIAHPRV